MVKTGLSGAGSTSAGVPLKEGMPMLVVASLQTAFAHGP
jgi:hypothetical protein